MKLHQRTFSCGWAVALLASFVAACGVGQDGTGAAPDAQATGVVTGFGSVVVDGVHFDVANAQIETDGSAGRSQADLRVGMVVTVNAVLAADGSSGTATRVVYDSLLRGAIDEAPGSQALRVLGQRIAIDSTTVVEGADALSDLRLGDQLQVSGFTDPAGGFRATWIRKEAGGAAPQLTGYITALNGTIVHLAGLTVDIAGAALVGVNAGTLAVGQRVRVVLLAAPTGAAAVATQLVLIDTALAGPLRRRALQGIVSAWNSAAGTFVLERQNVRIDADTQFQDGSLADLGNGARVSVIGPRGSDGVLRAERVLIFRPAIDGYVRGRLTAIDRVAQRFSVHVAPGLQVQLQARTLLSDRSPAGRLTEANLAVGDEVLALGWLNGGRINAGLVQRLPLLTPGVGIGGPVDSIGAGVLSVLGVTVNTASAQFFDAQGGAQTAAQFFAALNPGNVVRVEGGLLATTLFATTVRRVP